MNLVEQYQRQSHWRDWASILDAIPLQEGQLVLDMGAGVGDQAAELVRRGARVVGFDLNHDLVEAATARGLPGADFRQADVRALARSNVVAQGVWCSFTAAYIPDLTPVLRRWRALLQPGGWIAMTEVDNMFGHEPLDGWVHELLERYAQEAFGLGRYDFHMGHKLRDHLQRADFEVIALFSVGDAELGFSGRGSADVLAAWCQRFDRMDSLRTFCGHRYNGVRDAFLRCLERPDHRSESKVHFCLGRRP